MSSLASALRRVAAIAVVLVSALATAQGMPDQKPLRFLGNADLAPVVFARDGLARGVAVELVVAAAKAAGLDVRVEAMNWARAQAEMQQGQADALIHINPTPDRLQTLAFSAPLIESRFHIYRRRDRLEIQDLSSLKGKRVGVERASFPARFLADHPQVRTEFVTSWRDAFERLSRGELDAVFVDQWAGDFALTQVAGSDVVAVEPAVIEDHSRVAVAKGNTALLAALDRGLADIERNGTRQTILQRWSDQEVVYLTRQSVQHKLVIAVATVAGIAALLSLGYLVRLRRLNRELSDARDGQARAYRDTQEANARLRALTAEQAAVVDSEVVGIVKVRDRVVIWANQAFATMFGYRVDELVGQSTRLLYEDEAAFVKFGTRLQQVLDSEARFRGDMRQIRKDGTTGWFSFSVARLDKDSGIRRDGFTHQRHRTGVAGPGPGGGGWPAELCRSAHAAIASRFRGHFRPFQAVRRRAESAS